MKKRYFIYAIVVIIFILYAYFNLSSVFNIKNNERVLKVINTTFSEVKDTEYTSNDFASLEINKKDYLGVLSIPSISRSVPVETRCSSFYFKVQSLCSYRKKNLVVLGTNLTDSIPNYREIEVNDIISFTDLLGEKFDFKVEEVKNIKKLDEISSIDANLILVVKNYFELSYTVIIAN